MPIQNLTTNITKAFIRLGQIKKGEKQTVKRKDGSTFEKPVDLDYFRVLFDPGPNAAKIESTFREVYGDRPVSLNIRLPHATPAEVWDANYECYKQGGLIAKASTDETGAHWLFYRDPETAEVLVRDGSPVGLEGRKFMDEHPCDVSKPVYYNSKSEPQYMETVGRLQVVIPELAHLAVGYFVFQPGSPRDIRNISMELAGFDSIARQYGGSITGIPFRLIRRKETVTKKIDGKLTKGESWVVHLDAGGEWGARAIEMLDQLALPETVEGDVSEVVEADEPPYLAPIIHEPEPEKEMPYEQAKQVSVHVRGKEKFMAELTPQQLAYLIEHGTPEQKTAAFVVQREHQNETEK